MPTPKDELNSTLLEGSQRHECAGLLDHDWVMITHKDDVNEGVIWDNSTIGGPEFEAPNNGPMILGAKYCPFCGERLGEPDEITEAVIDVVEGALMCVDNIGYKNYSKDDFEKAMGVKGAFRDDRIQITILDPNLKLS